MVRTFKVHTADCAAAARVKDYIERGGRAGIYQIPVWWLKMILDGLEGKRVRLEDYLPASPRSTG